MTRAILIVSILLLEMLFQSPEASALKFGSQPSSRSRRPCPEHKNCVREPERIFCRASEYYWMEIDFQESVIEIPDVAMQINSAVVKEKFGELYLGQFRSTDGRLHLTTITPNGEVSFYNDWDVAGEIKVLCNYDEFQSNRFEYHTVWPGTMQSNSIEGSPDMKEASIIIGIENQHFVYLGRIVNHEPVYGKIVRNADGKYELVYRDDADGVEKRSEDFWVVTWHECTEEALRHTDSHDK